MKFIHGFYKNKKNGNLYYAEKLLQNATNTREDEIVVLYYPRYNGIIDFDGGYIRNNEEFMEKFIKVDID